MLNQRSRAVLQAQLIQKTKTERALLAQRTNKSSMNNFTNPTDSFGFEIDFLPVGEQDGDAICLRWGYNLDSDEPDQFVMVVDAGFKPTGNTIISLLSQYYDTDEIDLLVSTHPDGDHIGGFSVLLDNLTVHELWMHDPWNRKDLRSIWDDRRRSSDSIREQLDNDLSQAKEVIDCFDEQKRTDPFSGLTKTVKGVEIRILGPSEEYYKSLLPAFHDKSNHEEERVQYEEGPPIPWKTNLFTNDGWTTPKNNSSVILSLKVPSFGVILLTGDAGIPALDRACNYLDSNHPELLKQLQLFHIPHHGSIQNLGPTVLKRLLEPSQGSSSRWACASVAEMKTQGTMKHPSRHVLNAIQGFGVSCIATAGSIIHFATKGAPKRDGWTVCEKLPFFQKVEKTKGDQWRQ